LSEKLKVKLLELVREPATDLILAVLQYF